MKFFKTLVIMTGLFILMINHAKATDSVYVKPTYESRVTNQALPSPNKLVFEIRLKHTNPTITPFQLAGHQYFFEFNPAIANGGTLSYGIEPDSSDLPPNMRPRNPTITGTQLRLASNTVPGAGNGYIVPSTTTGIKVLKMRLQTTAANFGGLPFNISYRDSVNGNPYTKVFAYTGLNGNVNTDCTNSAWHFIDPFTGMNGPNTTAELPKEFALSQNFPNPFNPSTKIDYAIPVEGKVSLKIFDLTGREIASLVSNEVKPAGNYSVSFNGSNLASGVYFYRINVSGDKKFEAVKRMVLVK